MTTTGKIRSYSMVTEPVLGTSGTGLDQVLGVIAVDPGLAGDGTVASITGGATAAKGLIGLILEAATATGAVGGADKVFTVDDVVAINTYIRTNKLSDFTALHGDDEGGTETGFHLIQNNGSTLKFDGENAINTVFDGMFHIGFEIKDGRFVNEDGNANATVDQVASWLTQFFTDHSTTHTGLDAVTDMIMADAGLQANNAETKIEAGADVANQLNALVIEGIKATHADADGKIDAADVSAINAWIKADAGRYARFVALHGDDEGGVETGFHVVQNDGANTRLFGQNAVNTVFDGMYHIGFDIVDGRFHNEDGNANATVTDVASWYDFFYSDVSTTGTGLDRIVDTVRLDRGLIANTSAAQIMDGARAANGLNSLLVDGLRATGALADGWVTEEDLVAVNRWVNADAARKAQFVALHGDDEDGVETGFHRIQNDGGNVQYFGKNLINTVADGIYHFGFNIADGRFLNEDGNANARVLDVSSWLNYFLGAKTIVNGSGDADVIDGTAGSDQILASSGDDTVNGGAGDDLIYGEAGQDVLLGGAGNDSLYGGWGDDRLDGGDGSDTYVITGSFADGWKTFQGFDSYADTGTSGTDRIVARGEGNVDIGLREFSASSGIEIIDGTGVSGTVTLAGDWKANKLDFSTVTFLGGNVVIDGGWGDDEIIATAGQDTIIGGGGYDRLDGRDGSDTYIVTGNFADGWKTFSGFDTFRDTGRSGVDTIAARGTGDVVIGVADFSSETGIEVIDATGATGAVTVAGDWRANKLDFSSVTFRGTITIDAGCGSDTVIGTAGNDRIIAGASDDVVDGRSGSDTYIVTGNLDGDGSSFSGYDSYRDTGTSGVDRIVAQGAAGVVIGVKEFSTASGIEIIDGTGAGGPVTVAGDWRSNMLDFSAVTFVGGNIAIDAGWGNDTVIGSAGNDVIRAGGGDDVLDGRNGSDTYIVTGNFDNNYSTFGGYDSYRDTGTSGIDRILAQGAGNVVIGLTDFSAASGIEIIDGTGAGVVTVGGDWRANRLDFSATGFVGGNITIDAGWGNDTVTGSAGNDVIQGGGGDDVLDGRNGSDTYLVSGNRLNGWNSFQGWDTYRDTGTTGTDKIVATGGGLVEIGLKSFSAANGIEAIDGTGASSVTLFGDLTANTLDLSRTVYTGGVLTIEGGGGKDVIIGTAGNDRIIGGSEYDVLTGGAGADTFVFDQTAGSWNMDRITDFLAGTDKMAFTKSVFAALGPLGELAAAAFQTGTKALDADDRIIYNAATGALFYDADGSGKGAAQQVAQLNTNLALTYHDFQII